VSEGRVSRQFPLYLADSRKGGREGVSERGDLQRFPLSFADGKVEGREGGREGKIRANKGRSDTFS